ELFFKRVEVNGERVVSTWLPIPLIVCRSQIIGECSAWCFQLRRLEPIEVIVDFDHSVGKSGAQSFQLAQSHPNSAIFSESELRDKLLIILNDRAKDRVRVGRE